MTQLAQRSFSANEQTHRPVWYLVDAKDATLGRLAVHLARVLRGKHLPTFTPHALTGDFLVVVNADLIRVTGTKRTSKLYQRYSGYPGGRRVRTYQEVVDRDSTVPLTKAVRGMLMHNSLGERQIRRLKVYPGDAHPHEAQRPVPIDFGPEGQLVRRG